MVSRQKGNELEKSVMQESFRVLKSNIQFNKKDGSLKTITITSCSPGEGKTAVAFNLAVSMAGSGMRVLLVDAEFRKPESLQSAEKKIKPADVKQKPDYFSLDGLTTDTDIKNLDFISIGSNFPDPELFVESSMLESFIKAACEKYEAVIFDTPSLGGIIDSAIISSHTDGTVLVIQSGLHDYRTVQLAKEQLEKANARVLGVVLNKMNKNSFKPFFKYQRYYNRKNEMAKKEPDVLKAINIREYMRF